MPASTTRQSAAAQSPAPTAHFHSLETPHAQAPLSIPVPESRSPRILQSPLASPPAIAMASRKSSPRNTAPRAHRACQKWRARAAVRARSALPPPLRAPEHTPRPAVGRVPAREAPEPQETPSTFESAALPLQIRPHCSLVSLLGSRKAIAVSPRKEISPAPPHQPTGLNPQTKQSPAPGCPPPEVFRAAAICSGKFPPPSVNSPQSPAPRPHTPTSP